MQPNYYKHFASSKVHGGIGLAMGVAVATANPLVLMAAAAGYALAWLFLPTSKYYTEIVDNEVKDFQNEEAQQKLANFEHEQRQMVDKLNDLNKSKYYQIGRICSEVANNNSENGLIRRKLQELRWTYLKMLLMGQSIEQFLEESDLKKITADLNKVEAEIAALSPEQERLKNSKTSLKNTLTEHKKSIRDAADNLAVLSSEQTRVEHEIQLLRADSIANKDSGILSAKINASVESLADSKELMKTLNAASDLGADMPDNIEQLGFDERPRQRIRN